MKVHRYRINEVSEPVSREEIDPAQALAGFLNVSVRRISGVKILRQSLDSRRKNNPRWKYNLEFGFTGKLQNRKAVRLEGSTEKGEVLPGTLRLPGRIAVVGCGPAGMFAALGLAEKGYEVHVYEQGKSIRQRTRDIKFFYEKNTVNFYSNILNGEGGAGAFSDGKLTCRTGNAHTRMVTEILIACGAPESIRYLARPHLGSDRLPSIVSNLRGRAQANGVDFHFNSRVTGVEIDNSKISGLWVNDTRLPFSAVVLAAGHSARDLYYSMHQQGVVLEPKGFAVGVRVEHPQKLINDNQLGKRVDTALTGNAEYFLTVKKAGLRAYSFCMCPGGMVVPCVDHSRGICTNGMSRHSRNGVYANSAIVVPVEPDDCLSVDTRDKKGENPARDLCGLAYQEHLEQLGFEMGGGNFGFPAQTVNGYIKGTEDEKLPGSSFPKNLLQADFNQMFTDRVNRSLHLALHEFDKKIPGFIDRGLMIGPETRTSSPVRIVRDAETMETVSTEGLFPLGEGAGYAGGILSSAADGLKFAGRAKIKV